ncbi:hypothetical protein [Kitasatospora sp. LaBMicrA B282]|uniref:hypothetical protein n=1 Tax=Kitasatospora sp. LaBMicrA B282 TaxID=3420949 RepID=UPI003D0B4623
MDTGVVVLSQEGSSADFLLAWRDEALAAAPIELVPLHDLVVSGTPRTAGEDPAYVEALASLDAELPPILVHRATMTVVDGVHRLRAASVRGRDRIAARFFEGAEEDAVLLSVAMNVAHGRPLSLRDRAVAAEQIFAIRPHWSDRAVAAIAGLSAKKVSEIRLAAITGVPPQERRIGLDGRARPLNSAQGRELAGRLIMDDPSASLRTIARKAGISPTTVADVRDRVLRGDDPVPPGQRRRSDPGARPAPRARGVRGAMSTGPSAQVLLASVDALRRDPSLRLNDTGRTVLRMLDAGALAVRSRELILSGVPAHCRAQLAELMHGYAELWRVLATELQDNPAPSVLAG